MSAGTIALTNNSATVTGTGTSFTTELKPGDFVYVTVGGAPYTLVASTVTSDTQLTLAVAYDGPTTTGLAWNAVPASLQVAITQKILNDFAQVARGRILDFQNWQKIYSSDQSVTVTRPDRTTFTGPSWGYMATQYASKANTVDVLTKADNLNSLTDKANARTNLGLKGAAVLDVGTASGTVAAGNDVRIVNALRVDLGGTLAKTVYGSLPSSSGFMFEKNLSAASQSGSNYYNRFARVYSRFADAAFDVDHFESPGNYYAARFIVHQSISQSTLASFELRHTGVGMSQNGWQTFSDERIKTNINPVEDPLGKMKMFRGCTWDRLDGFASGRGFIAQDVAKAFPEAVTTGGNATLMDGTVISDLLSPDTTGVSAALHHEAILALMAKIEELEKRDTEKESIIVELQKRMKAIDGLDA